MALEAKLDIGDGREYDVIDCEYEMKQPGKDNNLPAGRPGGGLVHFTILAQDDNNMNFHQWMVDKTLKKNGSITFSAVRDAKRSTKTVAFENAICINLNEHFDKHSEIEMVMRITLLAETLKFGSGVKLTANQ